jgi:protein MpaA
LVACATVLVVALLSRPASAVDDANDGTADRFFAGKSVGGKPILCEVYGKGPDVMIVIATIHGNEAAGTPLVAAFGKWLAAHPEELEGRRVVIVPIANPDGMAANERFNARGVDLNRNFPAGNWQQAEVKMHGDTPLSEPESRVLMQLVCRYFPDRIISIHQPINCIDYDGPAQELAEAMADVCPLPVKKLGGRPGSLGSFVGVTLGKPIITWELPKDAGMDSKKLWDVYGQALIAALRFQQSEVSTGRE